MILKCILNKSDGKVWTRLNWLLDIEECLLVDFLPRGETISVTCYVHTLEGVLCTLWRARWRDTLSFNTAMHNFSWHFWGQGQLRSMNGILFSIFSKGHIPEDHSFYSHHCENLRFQEWDIVKVELIICYVENCRMAAWRCRWQFHLKHWYLPSTCHHIQILYVVLMFNTFHQTVVIMERHFLGWGAGGCDSDILYWNFIFIYVSSSYDGFFRWFVFWRLKEGCRR